MIEEAMIDKRNTYIMHEIPFLGSREMVLTVDLPTPEE